MRGRFEPQELRRAHPQQIADRAFLQLAVRPEDIVRIGRANDSFVYERVQKRNVLFGYGFRRVLQRKVRIGAVLQNTDQRLKRGAPYAQHTTFPSRRHPRRNAPASMRFFPTACSETISSAPSPQQRYSRPPRSRSVPGVSEKDASARRVS